MADQLLRAFRFKVTLLKSPGGQAGAAARNFAVTDAVKLGDGGFQECSGLQIDHDVQEYMEGGRNAGVIRRVGRAKYSNLVLKRGMFWSDEGEANRDLWNWIQGVVSGKRPIARYDGMIEVYSVAEEVVARWEFDRGLPQSLKGPELNAKTGEIAIEELHIAHEGLRLAEL
jgi:phage tail-like protein